MFVLLVKENSFTRKVISRSQKQHVHKNKTLHIGKQMHAGHIIIKKKNSSFLISLLFTGQIDRKQMLLFTQYLIAQLSLRLRREDFNGCVQVSVFLLTLIPVRLRLLIPAISLPNSHHQDGVSMQSTKRNNIMKSQH